MNNLFPNSYRLSNSVTEARPLRLICNLILHLVEVSLYICVVGRQIIIFHKDSAEVAQVVAALKARHAFENELSSILVWTFREQFINMEGLGNSEQRLEDFGGSRVLIPV
jgi:hypothetical protein